jgi:hypothetical protein
MVVLLQIVDGLWEIVHYPLLILSPAFFFYGLYCALMTFGVLGFFSFAVVAALPLCRAIIKREENYMKLLLHQ